jgi:hypothetical protein
MTVNDKIRGEFLELLGKAPQVGDGQIRAHFGESYTELVGVRFV